MQGSSAFRSCTRFRSAVLPSFLCSALATASLTVTGCISLYDDPQYPDYGPPAKISIHSMDISRWESYRDVLQPEFSLTADQAYEKVLATTLLSQQYETRFNGTSLAVGLPGTSTSGTSTLNQGVDAGGQVTTTVDQQTTQTLAPGQAPAISRLTPPQAAVADLSGGTLETDAMMRYWAAAALYQEVQLLNRVVKNFTDHEDYDAYVVRMQVGTKPYSRKTPLDTHIELKIELKEKTSDVQATLLDGFSTEYITALQPPVSDEDIHLFPLLISDNLERNRHSRSTRQVRDTAIAIQAMVQNAGLSLTQQSYRDLAQATLGNDYNSLLSVSKSGHNSLDIQLGALNSPSTKYAMVTRNHYITFLMLVNKNKKDTLATPALQFGSTINFREALTGKKFQWKLDRRGTDKSDLAYTEISHLPSRADLPHAKLPPNDQNAGIALIDDRKTTQIKLHGGHKILPGYVDAWITTSTSADLTTGSQGSPPFRLYHTDATLDPGHSNINLTFPSLSKLKLAKDRAQLSLFVYADRRYELQDTNATAQLKEYPVTLRVVGASPKASAASTMSAGDYLQINQQRRGEAVVTLNLKAADQGLTLHVSNAVFLDTTQTPPASSTTLAIGRVAKDQTVTRTLALAEMTPGKNVKFKLVNAAKHASPEIELPVIYIKP